MRAGSPGLANSAPSRSSVGRACGLVGVPLKPRECGWPAARATWARGPWLRLEDLAARSGASAGGVPSFRQSGEAVAAGRPEQCRRLNKALSRTPGRKGVAGFNRFDSQASVCALLAGRRLAPR